jgi:hypothetical protein
MAADEILYGGYEELAERIKKLKNVIASSERHGDEAGEHITRLQQLVSGMEDILNRFESANC